jgi:hypothetical protein
VRYRAAATLTIALLICAGSTASAGARATTATVYRPFTASGASRLSGPAKRGYCWTASETTGRHDAWRCASGNYIYDPCFSTAVVKQFVLCPLAPWRNTGIKLLLTRPVPTALANHGALSLRNQPWALELYDGRTCLLSGGASSLVNGIRLNYFCTNGGSTGLWGFPNRRTEPWTIYIAPYSATRLSQRATIKRAWM